MRPTPILVTQETIDYMHDVEEVAAETQYQDLDPKEDEGKPRSKEINTSRANLKHTAAESIVKPRTQYFSPPSPMKLFY